MSVYYKSVRKHKTYVDLESTIEVEAMGNQLDEINVENDYGSTVSVVYYFEGLKEFDNFLKDDKFFEFGLTFHLLSYENAFCFVLYHPQQMKFYHRVGVWRDNLIGVFNGKEHLLAPVVKTNRILNVFKAGAGEGIIGSLFSMAAGYSIAKIRGIKSKQELTAVFGLKFKSDESENGEEIAIVYTKLYNEEFVHNFCVKHFSSKDVI